MNSTRVPGSTDGDLLAETAQTFGGWRLAGMHHLGVSDNLTSGQAPPALQLQLQAKRMERRLVFMTTSTNRQQRPTSDA